MIMLLYCVSDVCVIKFENLCSCSNPTIRCNNMAFKFKNDRATVHHLLFSDPQVTTHPIYIIIFYVQLILRFSFLYIFFYYL